MDLLGLALMILHVLGCVGFVIVVSMGKIMAPVRTRIWPSMLSCPMCFGIWGGMAWAALLTARYLGMLNPWVERAHDAVAFACVVSLLGFLVALFDHAVGGLGSLKEHGKNTPSQ